MSWPSPFTPPLWLRVPHFHLFISLLLSKIKESAFGMPSRLPSTGSDACCPEGKNAGWCSYGLSKAGGSVTISLTVTALDCCNISRGVSQSTDRAWVSRRPPPWSWETVETALVSACKASHLRGDWGGGSFGRRTCCFTSAHWHPGVLHCCSLRCLRCWWHRWSASFDLLFNSHR